MVKKLKQPCFVENVGGVDVDVTSSTLIQFWSSSLSDVENVHLESSNKLSNVDVSQVVAIKTQVVA
jgi:hypothetical protein